MITQRTILIATSVMLFFGANSAAQNAIDYESCAADLAKVEAGQVVPKDRQNICAGYIVGFEDGKKVNAVRPARSIPGTQGSGTYVVGDLGPIVGTDGEIAPDEYLTIQLASDWRAAKQNGDTGWATIAGNSDLFGTKTLQEIRFSANNGRDVKVVIPATQTLGDWARDRQNSDEIVEEIEKLVLTLPENDNGYILNLKASSQDQDK